MIRPSTNVVVPPVCGSIFRMPRIAAVPASSSSASAASSSSASGADPSAVTGETLESYVTDFGANNLTTQATVSSIILVCANEAVAKPAGIYDSMFAPGAANQFVAICAPPAAAPTTNNETLLVMTNQNLSNAVSWIFNLVTAAKKGPLSVKNVEGFFASIGHTGTSCNCIAKLINSMAPFLPDEINISAARALLVENTWTTYRSTRASTGKVIFQNIKMLRELLIVIAGSAEDKAIIASNNAPWDIALTHAIPDSIKGYVCIFLETAGTPIDGWYQGSKARDAMPAARVRGAKEIFKRYLELKNDVGALNAAADIAAITAAGGPAHNFF